MDSKKKKQGVGIATSTLTTIGIDKSSIVVSGRSGVPGWSDTCAADKLQFQQLVSLLVSVGCGSYLIHGFTPTVSLARYPFDKVTRHTSAQPSSLRIRCVRAWLLAWVSTGDGWIPGLPPCRSDGALNGSAPLCMDRLRDQARKRVDLSIRRKLSDASPVDSVR
jgi:hypothetical protein